MYLVDLDYELFKDNSLLRIEDDTIHFIYEEVPKGEITLMALSFNKAAGGAKKSSITSYSYRDGDNEVRLVGDVLARYVYWLEGKNGKNIPFECLSFDRNEERFNN